MRPRRARCRSARRARRSCSRRPRCCRGGRHAATSSWRCSSRARAGANAGSAPRSCSRSSGSSARATSARTSSRAACASGSRWPARSRRPPPSATPRAVPGCCSWTSPSRRSTPSPATCCRPSCCGCGRRPARRSCSSPTTCGRRSGSRSAWCCCRRGRAPSCASGASATGRSGTATSTRRSPGGSGRSSPAMPPEPTPLRGDRSGHDRPDDPRDGALLTPPSATAVLEDAAAVAGLDALDTPTTTTRPWCRRALATGLPPLVALLLFLTVWQLFWASAIVEEFKVPAPADVWHAFAKTVDDGQVWSILWTSVSRAFIGFVVALIVATPLGLLVAKVRVVRAAIGPLLQGLQSLPSVAWVPAAVLGFGLTDATIYFVVLAGSIPSIANGLVAGIDQTPPILPRVAQVLGARGLAGPRPTLLPPAPPGYLAGRKHGWAFSWRSLMAAEIIAAGPLLGFGLGAYLKEGSDFSNMPGVIAAIFLILIVGIGIELLVFRPIERRVLQARGLAL